MILTTSEIIHCLEQHLKYQQLSPTKDKAHDCAYFDSRQCRKNSIFIAIDGESSKGVRYIDDAISNGANCVVLESKYKDELLFTHNFNSEIDYLFVDDPIASFGLIGKCARDKYNGNVIGVIGSVGKTTTKNILFELTGGIEHSYANTGSFNNETGVPLTLCSIPEESKVAVIELGESHFGDLDYVTRLATPNVLVITNVGDAHIEFLGDRNGVAKTMNESVLLMDSGIVVAPMSIDHIETVFNDSKADVVLVVDEANGQIAKELPSVRNPLYAYIKVIRTSEDLTHDIELEYNDEVLKIHIPLVGKHFIMNVALSAVASLAVGVKPDEIVSRIENVLSQKHRMQIIRTTDLTIVDDCYNANPTSMKASMDAVSDLAHGQGNRSVFIIGPMRELGPNSDELHEQMGKYAKQVGIDVLICVDKATYPMVQSNTLTNIHYFDTVKECINGLLPILNKGDVVGVKASRGPNPHEPMLVPVVNLLKTYLEKR